MRTPTVVCFLILAVVLSSRVSLSGSVNARLSMSQANGSIFQAVQIHDVAVTNLAVSGNEFYAGSGGTVGVDVTVENEGDFVEKFNVTVYANCTSEPVVVDIYYVSSLGPGDAISIPLGPWKVPDIPGNYTVIAEASPVEGETNTTNNVQTQYVNIKSDDTAPVIGIPGSDTHNSIVVCVWDSGRGVRDVILSWSIDNGTTWSNQTMQGPDCFDCFFAVINLGPDANNEGKLD